MALSNVNVLLGNGNIGGTVATSDGTTAIVMTGATEGLVTAGTPFLVTNSAEISALSLTPGNNALAVKFFNNFLAEIQNQGVNQFNLYVMLVANTMKVDSMATFTNPDGLKKLIDFAGGKVTYAAVMSNDGTVYGGGDPVVTTNGINGDCYLAKNALQTLCNNYTTTQWPMRGVVAGTSFSGTASALTDLKMDTRNRVSILIGDTASGAGCAMGLFLGRIAAIPVQRKASRVKNGPVSSSSIYIGATSADQYTSTTTIHDKGYITFRKFANKDGYYFTGDPTATAGTDDYSMVARGRVIDKVHRIAYAVFVEEIDEEVPLDEDGQSISTAFAKYLEQQIENQVNATMVATGNCSGVACFVDPNQNVASTSKVNVTLKITPVGYASTIEVKLSF